MTGAVLGCNKYASMNNRRYLTFISKTRLYRWKGAVHVVLNFKASADIGEGGRRGVVPQSGSLSPMCVCIDLRLAFALRHEIDMN